MSVRRDNRSGAAPPGGLHAKLSHDRHNQELLKQRLATHASRKPPAHTTPVKSAPTESVASPGGRAGPRGGGKGRMDASPKSFLRPTSSSAMKAASGAAHTTSAPRRLDSNRRPHPQATRKAVVGDAHARRAHARAKHGDKEEDCGEAKQRQDSLPETPDKDQRDSPPPAPTPIPPTPAPAPAPAPASPKPSPAPASPVASALNVTPLNHPATPPSSSSSSSPQPLPISTAVQTGPSPASQPSQAPPTPTHGPETRQEAKAQPPPQTCARPVGLQPAPAPSREAVLRGVRARVGEAPRGGGVDADKDVCEAAVEEEEEFYRVRVRTRLVSYDNSTLVIRNTSRGDAAPHHSDPEPEPPIPHPDPSPSTDPQQQPQPQPAPTLPEAHKDHQPPADLHPQAHPDSTSPPQASPAHHTPPTPSVPQPAMVAAPPAVSASPVHARATSAQLHAHAGAVAGAVAGAGAGMKRRLTLLVNRGRNFLAEVYSATQSRLDQYRAEGSPRPGPQRYPPDIPSPLEVEVNPMWLLQHAPQAHWLPTQGAEGAGIPAVPLHTPEGEAGGAGALLVETPVSGEAQEEAGAGVQVVVDEEWIKKNILCTCKCRSLPATRRGTDHQQVEEAEQQQQQQQQQQEEEVEKPEEQNVETEEHGSHDDSEHPQTHHDDQHLQQQQEQQQQQQEEEEEEEEEETREGKEMEEEEERLCYCSCHEGTEGAPLPHLPSEIQDLLDADHARMWWTITGNFGNILPIDWSKTYTRQQYLPVLNLNEMKEGGGGGAEEGEGGTERSAGDDGAGEEEEEEVAQDLDLHHLILNGLTAEPVKSAEEVIQEIDDIMQEGSSSEDDCVESSSSGENMQDLPTRPCPPHLYHDKLKSMSVPELNEALMELELVIRQYSETLITQLALRDELEYEKELKNSFISLLLQVQNKRRNFNVEKKKQKKVGPNGTDPKYLTTVIPYDVGHGPPHNPTLQILIKILTAINEDSPTVPTLLTDYILKVLCPS